MSWNLSTPLSRQCIVFAFSARGNVQKDSEHKPITFSVRPNDGLLPFSFLSGPCDVQSYSRFFPIRFFFSDWRASRWILTGFPFVRWCLFLRLIRIRYDFVCGFVGRFVGWFVFPRVSGLPHLAIFLSLALSILFFCFFFTSFFSAVFYDKYTNFIIRSGYVIDWLFLLKQWWQMTMVSACWSQRKR